MNLYDEDIIFFKELVNSGLLEIYSVHVKYHLSPFQIVRFIDTYQKLELIKYYQGSISLTDQGRSWLLANRNYILLKRHKFADPFTKKNVFENENKRIRFDKSIYRLLGQRN